MIKAKIPTRSRMSFIHHFPHYSPRLVVSLGIVQIISGVSIVFLNLVLHRLDRDKILSWSLSFYILDSYASELVRIVWIGGWILLSGLITLLVSCRPHSNCHIYLFCLTSLATVALTGIITILMTNNVIQHSVIWSILARTPSSPETDVEPSVTAIHRSNSILIFNLFLLCFSLVSFVISIISLSIVSNHLCCTCTMVFGSKHPSDYHIYDTGSTMSRKERIVQWVMQQSQQQINDLHSANWPANMSDSAGVAHDFPPNRKKLMAIHSSTTNSTKLSIYET